MTSIADTRPEAPSQSGAGGGILAASAAIWWWAALAGQAAFLFYLLGFYARTTLSGNFPAWNKAGLLRGYVPGDTTGNLYFASHVMLAIVVTFGGLLQMIPWIRRKAIGFHRWNGRAFMLCAVGGGFTGLWMVWVRGVGVGGADPVGQLSISLNGVLIFLFAAVAWLLVRSGRIAAHRRWALRLFMVANGVWFLRLMLFGWMVLTHGLWTTERLDGPMNDVIDFASYLLPLGVLELYLRARDGGGAALKLTAAAALLASTAYMGVGIFVLALYHAQLVMKV